MCVKNYIFFLIQKFVFLKYQILDHLLMARLLSKYALLHLCEVV